jgi:MFS family permease
LIARFSLYGFLKNQQYYDPFLLLAFREMGVSYTSYGLLIAFRELIVNVLEIPSGAVADVLGRRKCMIVSFMSYIASFLLFGLAGHKASTSTAHPGIVLPALFVAMFCFAVGDAFRSGTHKAMIFTWLRIHGRTDERTRVYGYTRSWSKIGSAVSVLLACIFVFVADSFYTVFFFAAIPYAIGIINFLGYPKELDGDANRDGGIREVTAHLRDSCRAAVTRPYLRRLLLESMGFEGFFKAAKDYLQPILQAAALLVTARLVSGVALSDVQKSVILVGPVFCALYIMSAVASRKAHVLVDHHGHEDASARWIWGGSLAAVLCLTPAMYFGVHALMIAGFAALYILQNLWRPILMSRIYAHSDEGQGATVLSVESQAKSLATMLMAPLLGLAIDAVARHDLVGRAGGEFWPIGILGIVIAGCFLLTAKQQGEESG